MADSQACSFPAYLFGLLFPLAHWPLAIGFLWQPRPALLVDFSAEVW
jgi:hypothetical protein